MYYIRGLACVVQENCFLIYRQDSDSYRLFGMATAHIYSYIFTENDGYHIHLLSVFHGVEKWREGEEGGRSVICNLYFLVNKIENLESTY